MPSSHTWIRPRSPRRRLPEPLLHVVGCHGCWSDRRRVVVDHAVGQHVAEDPTFASHLERPRDPRVERARVGGLPSAPRSATHPAVQVREQDPASTPGTTHGLAGADPKSKALLPAPLRGMEDLRVRPAALQGHAAEPGALRHLARLGREIDMGTARDDVF